jgi:D-alanyl-D-alanine carboxypeptidase
VKNSFGKYLKIEKETLEKFNELRTDLLKEWVDIELDSAYRSFSIQNEFFDKFKEEYGIEYASQYAAPAGYSEHHTWLAVDICLKKEDGEIISENHEMIVELWVFDRVHKKMVDYGFIVRYPDGKDSITWYSYEPWHLRYVGDADIAKEIMEKWLTLEEYLNKVWK